MSVPRHRLLRLLAEPASTSAVLLVAPPGYGKTVLLQQYAEDERLIYINLSTVANRESLVRELIAQLAPRTLRSLGTLLGQQANSGFDSILATWMLVRLRTVETTIVLDDLQHVAGDDLAMEMLSSLIEGTRSHIRWILASRQMPILPIGTWIAHSITSLPINERDLSFSLEEARELAISLDVTIGDDDLGQIVRHNAGWPIGIRLSIEAWHRFRSTQPLLIETRNVLFNYLQTELWKNLSRVQRELILACALLPRITINLLEEAGYANAARLLTTLERLIPFVTKNPDRTYSIHELFRDFALDASRQRSGFVERILRRVGGALARHERYVEALDLAIQAQSPDHVLDVLGVGGLQMLETGARQAVYDGIAALTGPERDHAIVRALRGAIAHSDGNASNAEGLYRSAIAARGLTPSLQFEVMRRIGVIAYNRGDGAAALEMLEPLVANPDLTLEQRVEAMGSLASAHAIAGNAASANEAIEFVEKNLDKVGIEARTRVLDRVALASYYTGDHLKARARAIDASTLAQEIGLDRVAATAYSVLYAVAAIADTDGGHLAFYAREQAAAAERAGDQGMRIFGLHAELVAAAESADQIGTDRVLATLATLGQASTYRDQINVQLSRAILEAGSGDIARAISMLEGMDGVVMPAEKILVTMVLALFDLALGKRDEALLKVSPGLLVEVSLDFISQRNINIAHTFRGFALWMLDRKIQAERALSFDRSSLGARDRVLVDAIREITRFPHPLPNAENIEAACKRVEDAGLGAYAMLFRRLSTRDKDEVDLTPAELQMLRTFYEYGGRTADVAAALKKSPYTIRNQIRSTIAKLGCAGRNEAIVYARQRGWF